MTTKTKPKLKPAPKCKIESVTVGEKSIEVMITGARLVFDGISEVIESVFEGVTSYRFTAGIEIADSKELETLIKTIRTHFGALKMNGWAGNVAVQHFDAKKFKPSNSEEGRLLYPTSPAEETEDGGFQSKGKLFVNPSHDAFYAGCYVDVKIAFVANVRGAITIKDYLNGIRFNQDGEPLAGATDPWGDSQTKAVVTGVRRAKEDEAPQKPQRRAVKGRK